MHILVSYFAHDQKLFQDDDCFGKDNANLSAICKFPAIFSSLFNYIKFHVTVNEHLLQCSYRKGCKDSTVFSNHSLFDKNLALLYPPLSKQSHHKEPTLSDCENQTQLHMVTLSMMYSNLYPTHWALLLSKYSEQSCDHCASNLVQKDHNHGHLFHTTSLGKDTFVNLKYNFYARFVEYIV